MASVKFNPFRPGNLVSPGMFAGRSAELRSLERILVQTKNRNPLHFMIRGERGIGKSSLLLVLKNIAEGDLLSVNQNSYKFMVVNIELEPNISYGEIIKKIGADFQREMIANSRSKELAKRAWDFLKKWEIMGVKYDSELRDLAPHELLDDLVSTIDMTLKPMNKQMDGVLIAIDEADKPPSSANLGEFCKLFTERLMKRGCDRVALGLSGLPQTVDRLKESHESSPRVFQDMFLGPLVNEDCFEVIRKGLAEGEKINKKPTTIDPEAEQLILEYSELD